MNILILNWRSPKHPNAGGAEYVTLKHAARWVQAAHEVWWFSSSFKGAKGSEETQGVKIVRRGGQIFGVQIYAFFWYFFGKHSKFDLVVDQFHGIPFFTPLYSKAGKLAFIHEVAGEVWKLNPWPKPLNLIPAALGSLFEPWIFKVFYRKTPFLTVSESTKKDLETFGILRRNIHVIHNGIEAHKLRDFSKEKLKTAIFLGALSEDKGIYDAIKVFSEINRKDEDWQFWIVGPGTSGYVKILKNLSKECGIINKLKIWGFVPDAKKFELLASAHVLINPSVREGWGLVNIEANSVGTPVIGYDVSGIKDSVKNGITGILVAKGDFRGMAENAIKLLGNKSLYTKFQDNCKKWASKFSWEKATSESLELIESL